MVLTDQYNLYGKLTLSPLVSALYSGGSTGRDVGGSAVSVHLAAVLRGSVAGERSSAREAAGGGAGDPGFSSTTASAATGAASGTTASGAPGERDGEGGISVSMPAAAAAPAAVAPGGRHGVMAAKWESAEANQGKPDQKGAKFCCETAATNGFRNGWTEFQDKIWPHQIFT